MPEPTTLNPRDTTIAGASVCVTACLAIAVGLADPSSVLLTIYLVTVALAGATTALVAGVAVWSSGFPPRPHGHQVQPDQPPAHSQPAAIVVNSPAPPVPNVRAQTSAPPPKSELLPQRPVQAGDFAEPAGSIFDGPRSRHHSPILRTGEPGSPIFDDLFGVYRAPNQPLPDLDKPDLDAWQPESSPWDDELAPAPDPKEARPRFPIDRRPPTLEESELIREIYAETNSLNATIRRVYGSEDRSGKDLRTLAWVKEALQDELTTRPDRLYTLTEEGTLS